MKILDIWLNMTFLLTCRKQLISILIIITFLFITGFDFTPDLSLSGRHLKFVAFDVRIYFSHNTNSFHVRITLVFLCRIHRSTRWSKDQTALSFFLERQLTWSFGQHNDSNLRTSNLIPIDNQLHKAHTNNLLHLNHVMPLSTGLQSLQLIKHFSINWAHTRPHFTNL